MWPSLALVIAGALCAALLLATLIATKPSGGVTIVPKNSWVEPASPEVVLCCLQLPLEI